MASSARSAMAKTFLECIELSEGFTDYPVKPAASAPLASWNSPRISFSNELVQIGDGEDGVEQQPTSVEVELGDGGGRGHGHKPSSSGEFEFSIGALSTQVPVKCPMLSADELFYKGKLLPLHLPPRIRMVQDLSEVEQEHRQSSRPMINRSPALAMMRRERSLRSPARPAFVPSTLKSSSYPPPGYTSRPSSPPKAAKCSSSSSRWKDLFGFKKQPQAAGKSSSTATSQQTPGGSSSSSSSKQAPSSSKFLKMIFNRGSASNVNIAGAGTLDQSTMQQQQPGNEAMVPLLGRTEPSSTNKEAMAAEEMAHSSSVSSSASSNWTTSSACSSAASNSSFSADFPDIASSSRSSYDGGASGVGSTSTSASRPPAGRPNKVGTTNSRIAPRGSPGRRRGVPARSKPVAGSSQALTRSGSTRKAASTTTLGGGRMQLQDHIKTGSSSSRPQSDSWRRPESSKPGPGNGTGYSSSVRVTPVLHVPACISPSLKNVKVHGFRRLFSSSSSAASASNKAPEQPVVAVM